MGLLAVPAYAQEKATITGTVTDPSGSVIPNVAITITNSATGQTRDVVSNGAGLYTASNLGIGNFMLKAAVSGFKTYTQNNIILNVNDTLRVDVHLEVGSEQQTVTVEANALQLQAETNEVSSLISGVQITQLATNSRNVVSLAALGLGVSGNLPDDNTPTSVGSNFNMSFNGARVAHNLWVLDGGEDSDRGGGGGMSIMPSIDSLAEFQTLSSNYSADYGISSGGTITMALKSGTRNFHGSLWEFNRNDIFDANAYFNKQTTPVTPVPKLRFNTFGGNVGGPLFIPGLYNRDRKKTFFFVNEEWRRIIQGSNPNLTNTIPASDFPTAGQPLTYISPNGGAIKVPTTNDPAKLAIYKSDGLTAGQPFPKNVIPANLLDPNAVLFMSTGGFPKPNSGLSQVALSANQPIFVREDIVRMDHNITDKWQLMGHFVHDGVNQTYATSLWNNDSYPTVGTTFTNPSYSAVIKLTGSITPSLLNEVSFNYDGNIINIQPTGVYKQPSGWSVSKYFSGDSLARLPEIDLGAPYSTNYNTGSWPWHNAAQDYNPKDDISWTKGKHAMKFGVGYMRYTKNQQLFGNTEGTYTFSSTSTGDSYASFLLGFADSYKELQQQDVRHYVNNTVSFYTIDNWHLTPRLTLNLGFRYDALPHAWERNNRLGNFVPSSYVAANAPLFNSDNSLNPNGPGFSTPAGVSQAFYMNGIQIAGVNGVPRGMVDNYYATAQPRIGFALDLLGNGKTILRGGFGTFYERVQGNDVYNVAPNPPFAYQPTASNVYFSNPHTSNQSGATATTPVFPSGLTTLPRTYPSPATAQFSLGIQHELAPSLIGVFQYVGSGGWHQSDDRDINTLPLSDLAHRQLVAANSFDSNRARQYPGFNSVVQQENASNVSYHSLQAGIRSENKHGLTAQLDYTYSHEIDIVSAEFKQVSNPFDLNYDRGSGLFDRRHILNANYVYNIPFMEHSSNRLTKTLVGGWQISGIMMAQAGLTAQDSGNNLLSYNQTDTLGLGGGTTNRPNWVGKVSYPKKQGAWFSTSSFAAPVAPWAGGTNQGFGTARKDAVVGPGRLNFNTSLFKSFPVTEGAKFEFRAESFNTFNHTQFNAVDMNFSDSKFGQTTNTQEPRVLQFAAKFLF